MNSLNINLNQKDITKGQKLFAAVYLVTDHISESDPIRHQLRSAVTTFLCSHGHQAKESLSQLEMLLGGATFAGLIGEKNSSIIVYEAKLFFQNSSSSVIEKSLHDLFDSSEARIGESQRHIKDIKRTHESTLVLSSNRPLPSVSQTKNLLNKSARQDTILSFINDRKSAVIKDIISLFPDVSEKTIQRELNALIDSGKITKRGSKRWSIYMAVNSLL